MTQGGQRPAVRPGAARVQSLPPAARTSAEHVRALEAAGLLDLRLFKKFAQRPLMSVWEGEDKAGQRVLLTVLDACGTPPERARIMGAAHALTAMAGKPGIQHVHSVLDGADAFLGDFLGAGSAADLVVLRWPQVRRLEFVCQVCEALVALHDAGIVHGCLCPDNILLNDDLRAVLSEVGMVSIAESLEGDPENFFGYGAFAAPQARRGAPDVESDIFSVGRLLSFVILDRTPEDEASFAEIDAKSPEVAAIVRRCTSPAGQAYSSMAEVLADLQRCKQTLVPTEGLVTRRPPPPKVAAPVEDNPVGPRAWAEPKPKTKSGAPWWVALASGTAIVALSGVGQAVVVSSGALHFVLEVAVALAAVGVSAVIRTTTGGRVALTLGVLVVAFAGDPIGRLSRLDAADTGTRGDAARAFVKGGGKDLHGKHFPRADFSGLNLRDADLGGADFTAGNFTGAKLNNARMQGTSLLRANMDGADLSGVALDQAYAAETAACDAATVLPADWHCAADGRLKSGAPMTPPI